MAVFILNYNSSIYVKDSFKETPAVAHQRANDRDRTRNVRQHETGKRVFRVFPESERKGDVREIQNCYCQRVLSKREIYRTQDTVFGSQESHCRFQGIEAFTGVVGQSDADATRDGLHVHPRLWRYVGTILR